jgi:histidine ammonia-lyase
MTERIKEPSVVRTRQLQGAGWLRRIQAQAEDAATVALCAPSNNPIFVGPDDKHPYGSVLSNGGFNSAVVAPSLDALARSWAGRTTCLPGTRRCMLGAPSTTTWLASLSWRRTQWRARTTVGLGSVVPLQEADPSGR